MNTKGKAAQNSPASSTILRVGLLAWALFMTPSHASAQGACLKSAPQPSECFVHYEPHPGETFWPRNGACTCVANPSGYQDCWVPNPVCAPAPTKKCPWCGGAPIDFASGDTYLTQVDIKVPGLGGGLSLQRSWHSVWPQGNGAPMAWQSTLPVGMFGPGWTSNFEDNIYLGNDGYMKRSQGDGNVYSFGFSGVVDGSSQFTVAGQSAKNTVLTEAPSNWTLTQPNGDQELFDGTSGKILSITDRNGNVTRLTYDASFRLVTVTDPVSRHLYFSYATPSSYLVTSVTSDFGISLSYSYDTLGRLVQYTRPDNTGVSFQYNDNNPNLITAVLDSDGKLLESHAYNSCAQGTSSSRANGVESITLSYPLECHTFSLSQ